MIAAIYWAIVIGCMESGMTLWHSVLWPYYFGLKYGKKINPENVD